MCVLIGCRHRSKKYVPPPPTSVPAPVIEKTEVPLTPPKAPKSPVKQGPAPLAYILLTDAVVQVVEVETGTMIAQLDAQARSIVSVDEKAGVRIGNALIVSGPLPAGRTYQIFLETGSENVFRNQRISPGR